MKCVFGEMKERTEREKMKKRGGVEAWGEHPYRRDDSLGDPRYVGQRDPTRGQKVALCLRTSVYSSTRIWEKKDGCGREEWVNRPLLWGSGSRYRSPWEPGAEGVVGPYLASFSGISHTEQPSRAAPR